MDKPLDSGWKLLTFLVSFPMLCFMDITLYGYSLADIYSLTISQNVHELT